MTDPLLDAFWSPSFQRTLEIAMLSIAVSDYCEIRKDGTAKRWTAEPIVEQHMKNPLMPVESIRQFLLFALNESDRKGPDGIVDKVAVAALYHPACPTDLLTRACRCQRTAYRLAAAANLNCLEEDAVYAALLDGASS